MTDLFGLLMETLRFLGRSLLRVSLTAHSYLGPCNHAKTSNPMSEHLLNINCRYLII